MKYIDVKIETGIGGLEPLISALMDLGITDTVVEDPRDIEDLLNKKNDYDWDYVDAEVMKLGEETPSVQIFLDADESGEEKLCEVKEAVSRLKKQAENGIFGEDPDFGTLEMTVQVVNDEDWKDNWKEYFKPLRAGKSIVVKPTWEDYTPHPGDKIIEIDPGMAFGTGGHETTSLCIRLMEDYQKAGDTVLDVGCGSGILSIAGALLGASKVVGIEIDPQAVEIARENIRLNHVENVASAQYGDLTEGIDMKADLIVANLMADLVMMLSKDVAAHLAPGGKYISSGILVEKKELVADTIRSLGFRIVEIREDGMWCAIVAEL